MYWPCRPCEYVPVSPSHVGEGSMCADVLREVCKSESSGFESYFYSLPGGSEALILLESKASVRV